MLKIFLLTLLFLISFNAFPCWKAEGELSTDGEVWKFNQKFEHGKEYIIPAGNYFFSLTLITKDKKRPTLKYEIKEKTNLKIILVSKGEEEDLELDKSKDIYAKGEPGQPHSIISIKISKI